VAHPTDPAGNGLKVRGIARKLRGELPISASAIGQPAHIHRAIKTGLFERLFRESAPARPLQKWVQDQTQHRAHIAF